MKYIVGGLLLLVIFGFGLAFSAHNELLVEVNYFIAKGQFQLAHLLAVAFLFGVTLTLGVCLFIYIKLRLHNRYLRSRLRKTQIKLEQSPKPELLKNITQDALSVPALGQAKTGKPNMLERS